MAGWIKICRDPTICYLQETPFSVKDTRRLKVKGWKQIFHANRNQKRAGVPVLPSHKVDFKSKTVIRDQEDHYVMIKVNSSREK